MIKPRLLILRPQEGSALPHCSDGQNRSVYWFENLGEECAG